MTAASERRAANRPTESGGRLVTRRATILMRKHLNKPTFCVHMSTTMWINRKKNQKPYLKRGYSGETSDIKYHRRSS